MTLTTAFDAPACAGDWPAEVDLIVTALAAGEDRARLEAAPVLVERQSPRIAYRVGAELRLFCDTADDEPAQLYTRDVSVRGLGFITSRRLPLGYGGTVELPAPDGRVRAIHCTLLRCRAIAIGWFDCALHFNREQPAFAAHARSQQPRQLRCSRSVR